MKWFKFRSKPKHDDITVFSKVKINNGQLYHHLVTKDPIDIANALLCQAEIAASKSSLHEDLSLSVVVTPFGTNVLSEPEWHVLVDELGSRVNLVSSCQVPHPEKNVQHFEYTFRKVPRPR